MKVVLDTSAYVAFKRNHREATDMILRAELISFDKHFHNVAGLVCTVFNGL